MHPPYVSLNIFILVLYATVKAENLPGLVSHTWEPSPLKLKRLVGRLPHARDGGVAGDGVAGDGCAPKGHGDVHRVLPLLMTLRFSFPRWKHITLHA